MYKKIKEFPRYLIGSNGTVIRPGGRIRRPHKVGNNYWAVRFPRGRTRWYKRIKKWERPYIVRGLATLILTTFTRPRRKEEMVGFRDHNKSNCQLSNLHWQNRKERYNAVAYHP